MHGWEYTKRELEAVLGGDISSYFDSIDTVAFASGSIAQVVCVCVCVCVCVFALSM